jgi:opacity protein-like surface antigen
MKKVFESVAVAAFAVLGMSSAQAADPATLAYLAVAAAYGLDPADNHRNCIVFQEQLHSQQLGKY